MNSEPVHQSATVTVDSPYELARWRAFFQWVLYIPHGIMVAAMGNLSIAVAVLHWLVVLFTGRVNKDLYDINAMILRYETRTNLYLFGFSDRYPRFAFSMGESDDGAYPPVGVELPAAPESVSRVKVFNVILAIPHYIWIGLVGIAAMVVLVIAWFAVIFTGAWPSGMRDFIVRFSGYYSRVWAYVMMVDNKYPSFSLS